ncbi:hypothetical protein [Rhodococcus tukisamuensis]|uniref:Uncharacterized protein n=1 Tax=Rhodococcus tukisamuensis TaxID=168276 RepID=A0A1G6UAQ5_9NOCA|nr:hypothetical protein [Rhodococcus tukisamuensis]SDD38482.1 hypothetical protein SAMN05444580_104131 [Rhodococcus tukisamuensis]
MTLVGVLLLIIGTVGTIGSILFGALAVGQWAGAIAVLFVMVGVTGVLLIKPQR